LHKKKSDIQFANDTETSKFNELHITDSIAGSPLPGMAASLPPGSIISHKLQQIKETKSAR
jgi:hypothetical protein